MPIGIRRTTPQTSGNWAPPVGGQDLNPPTYEPFPDEPLPPMQGSASPLIQVVPDNWFGAISPAGFPQVTSDPVAQARYEQMRMAGESHSMAEMLSTHSFPGAVTDATFMKGRHNHAGLESMSDDSRNYYLQQAEQAGVSTGGQAYMASLARFPGDPTAWVDSRADVERVARQNGMAVTSPTINVDPPRYFDPGPPTIVAPELVNREVAQMIAENPGLKNDAPGLRQDIIEKRRGYHALPDPGRMAAEEGIPTDWLHMNHPGPDGGGGSSNEPDIPAGLRGLDLD
jgi:hypothetical protein